MKKLTASLMFLALIAIAPAAQAKDTMADKTGDWFATLGKSKNEKNKILAKRHLKRVGDELKQGFKKAGEDFNKKFGSKDPKVSKKEEK